MPELLAPGDRKVSASIMRGSQEKVSLVSEANPTLRLGSTDMTLCSDAAQPRPGHSGDNCSGSCVEWRRMFC